MVQIYSAFLVDKFTDKIGFNYLKYYLFSLCNDVSVSVISFCFREAL